MNVNKRRSFVREGPAPFGPLRRGRSRFCQRSPDGAGPSQKLTSITSPRLSSLRRFFHIRTKGLQHTDEAVAHLSARNDRVDQAAIQKELRGLETFG